MPTSPPFSETEFKLDWDEGWTQGNFAQSNMDIS